MRHRPAIATWAGVIGTHDISYFDTYPNDFPREVAPADSQRGEIFKPEKVRLVRVFVPSGPKRCYSVFAIGIEFDKYDTTRCLPESLAVGQRVVVAVGFSTPSQKGSLALSPSIAVPLAADATLEIGTNAAFPFTMALAGDDIWIDSQQVQTSRLGPRLVYAPFYGDLTPPRALAGDPADGSYVGRLVLKPSRPVALRTNRLGRYSGDTLEFRLPVEIVTQQPDSMTEPPPPSAHP